MRILGIILATAFLAGCKTGTLPAAHNVKVAPQPMLTQLYTASTTANVYTILGYANTNHPTLITNRWPKRVHINLATDGTNFSRRIGYGVPTDDIRHELRYEYALPYWDYSLITTNARIQITDLAGTQWCLSQPYSIAGLYFIEPAAGATLVNGAPVDIVWYQVEGLPVVNLGYIVQGGEFTVLQTISNVVAGSNTYNWIATGLPATNAIRLGLQSVSDLTINNITEILGSL
jgi:hypothetical protein